MQVSTAASPGAMGGPGFGLSTSFSPASVNLALWVRPSRKLYTLNGSSEVTSITNEGSLGGTFAQFGARSLPTITSVGGRDAIAFENDELQSSLAASAFKFLHDGTGGRLIMVFRYHTSGAIRWLLGNSASDAAGPGIQLYGTDAAAVEVFNGSEASAIAATGSNALSDNTLYVVGLQVDDDGEPRVSFHLNGDSKTVNNAGTTVFSSADPPTPLVLGGRVAADGFGATYDLLDIAAWNAAIPDASFQAELAQFNNFWGAY